LVKKNKKFMAPSLTAALLLAAGAASAQSNVTVYGRIVAGVDYNTHVSTNGVTSGSRWDAASNQWGTNLIGIKGAEDLGGGSKAIFDLESGFSSNTGATNNAALFNRFAYVGLSSSTAGTVKLGNILSISNDVWYIDPMGQQAMGSAALDKGRNWLNAPNSVQYESPDMGGFTAIAQYSFDETAGSNSANGKRAVSLAYVQPAYEIRAMYDVARDATGKFSDIYNTSKELILGGTATFGNAKLFAAYQSLSAPDAAAGTPSKAKHYWVGINYQLTTALQLLSAVYHITPNNGASSANLYAIGTIYNLSKRTFLYATIGSVQNGANGTYSERYWEPHVPGQDQTAVYFGITHLF
jgi:predicted porin